MKRFLIGLAVLALTAFSGKSPAQQTAQGYQVASLSGLLATEQTAAGGRSTCTTNGSDGYALAPGGPPQYPNLLSGYPVSPHTDASPWCVAGVDYAVGYPTGTVLTDWQKFLVNKGFPGSYHTFTVTAAASGGATTVTLSQVAGLANGWAIAIGLDDGTTFWTTTVGSPTGSVVTIATGLPSSAGTTHKSGAYYTYSNPTVITNRTTNGSFTAWDKVDFSLHGGAVLSFIGVPNGSVTNSYFGGLGVQTATYVINADGNSPGLLVKNNVMDGGALVKNQTVTISIASPAVVTLPNHGLVAGQMLTISSSTVVTGSISGTTLTVSAVSRGVLSVGDTISSPLIAARTTILSQLTGTTGGIGTYSVSISQSVVSGTISELPTGITASVYSAATKSYWIIAAGMTTNTFEISATAPVDGADGSPVNTSGSQSGTQTIASGGSNSSLVYSSGGGTVTVEYNWFKNWDSHILDLAGPSSGSNLALTYNYNLIDTGNITIGAHMNWMQEAGGVWVSPVIAYNTSIQNTIGGAEGYKWNAYGGALSISSPTLANNVEIALPSGGTNTMSYMNHGPGVSTTTVAGIPTAKNNYIDPTGAFGAFYPVSFLAYAPNSTPAWTFSNQWNMATGVAIPNTPP